MLAESRERQWPGCICCCSVDMEGNTLMPRPLKPFAATGGPVHPCRRGQGVLLA